MGVQKKIGSEENGEPLVSIIIPTYNRAHLISETLNSVKAQSYRNWEALIVDDGSSDGTSLIVEKYLEKDKRFRFLRRPEGYPKGAPACRNFGFEKSMGSFINYLDSDDLLEESKIAIQIEALQDSPSNTVGSCKWGFFLRNPKEDFKEKKLPYKDRLYTPLEFFDYLGEANTYMPPHCYLVPREIIERSNGWLEDLHNNQDGEFFVRILLNSSGVQFVNKTKVFYRKSTGDNVSSYSSFSKVESVVRSWGLIEAEFLKKFKEKKSLYLTNSKDRLFQNLLWENPDMVNHFPIFFEEQLRRKKREKRFKLLKRFYRRLSKKLSSNL